MCVVQTLKKKHIFIATCVLFSDTFSTAAAVSLLQLLRVYNLEMVANANCANAGLLMHFNVYLSRSGEVNITVMYMFLS